MAGQCATMRVWIKLDSNGAASIILQVNVIVDDVIRAAYEMFGRTRCDAKAYYNRKELKPGSIAPNDTTDDNAIEMQSIGAASQPSPETMLTKSLKMCPSSFGINEWINAGDYGFHTHRPNGRCGDHVTLFYNGFREFIEDCDRCLVTCEDATFTMDLVTAMGRKYDKEGDRAEIYRDLLTRYFGCELNSVSRHGYNVDGEITYFNSDLKSSHTLLLLEVKNEVGQGKADSYNKGLAYYYFWNDNYKSNSLCPCYFTELVGGT